MSLVLKAIGFWVSDSKPQFRHPKDDVGTYQSNIEKQKLIDYLNTGVPCIDYMGYSYCRFGCDALSEMGASDLTDGHWVWPQGLTHYVEVHDVFLPEQFIEHVIKCNWKIPDVKLPYSRNYDYTLCENSDSRT